MLVTTDQYRCYRSLVKYLKKLYINSDTNILNEKIYFMSINMVSENMSLLWKHYWIACNFFERQHKHRQLCNIYIFLDIQLFVTVDHKILLSKLDFYGIRGVSHEWLKSHHCERNKITVIDGNTIVGNHREQKFCAY